MRARGSSVSLLAAAAAAAAATLVLGACGGSSHPTPARSGTGTRAAASPSPRAAPTLIVGRLPTRQGFGIRIQRYGARGGVYLSASIVPAAPSVDRVRYEVNTGMFGSSQSDPNQALGRYLPSGLVGCSAHPVILLFGLLGDRGDSVVLRSDGVGVPLKRVPVPADLGVRADALYGAATSGDERLVERSANGTTIESVDLPAPPNRRSCAAGTTTYMFPVGH